MEVEAINDIGASVGDRVLISFDTGKLMGISFFLYVFPILLLIAGAVLGQKFSVIWQLDESLASAVGGFAFFGVAFLIVRWGSTAFARKREYQPAVSKIVGRENAA